MTGLVAHPASLVGEGIVAALQDHLGMDAVLETTVEGAWDALDTHDVELVVLDAGLVPGGEADQCVRLAERGVPVVVVTDPATPRYLELLASGAAGLTPSDDGLEGLVTAVETVRDGHVHVPAHLLGTVLRELVRDRRERLEPPDRRLALLSPRELEVLGLLGSGSDTRDIAATLVISPHTAKTHINRVLGKLGLASRTEAATFAIDHGLLASMKEAEA